MLKRIKLRVQKVEIERENKVKELLEIQNDIKRIDGKLKKLNFFKHEYEELVNKFNQFIKAEFTRK